jgi:hypothetical protein
MSNRMKTAAEGATHEVRYPKWCPGAIAPTPPNEGFPDPTLPYLKVRRYTDKWT